jgi:hypothetical protein
MVSVRGNSQLKRRMRTKGFLKSFFDSWDHLYLSMDGEHFHIYTSRSANEPILALALADIRNVHVELITDQYSSSGYDAKKEKQPQSAMDDKFALVITTSTRDLIQLR